MAERKLPYGAFNFLVDLGGENEAGFSDVSGLNTEITVADYRNGNERENHVHKVPGVHKVGDITLKRGVTKSTELYDWHKNIVNGVADRRNGAITLLDDDGTDAVRWKFSNGLPRKYEGPNFNAKGNDVAIESLVICCERIERES